MIFSLGIYRERRGGGDVQIWKSILEFQSELVSFAIFEERGVVRLLLQDFIVKPTYLYLLPLLIFHIFPFFFEIYFQLRFYPQELLYLVMEYQVY